MSRKNVDAIRDIYDVVMRGDLKDTVIDPQIEWIEPEVSGLWFGGVHHGREAVLNDVMRPTEGKFDDFRLDCEQFLDAGDFVVVTGHFHGRARETDILLDAPFAHVWQLRNGKAVRFQNYTNTANWLQALYQVHIEPLVGTHA